MSMKKGTKKAAAVKQTPAMAITRGVLLSAAIAALLCALFAYLTLKGVLAQSMTAAGGSAAAAIASFAGAFFAAKKAKSKKLVLALIVSAAFAAVLLIINVLFFALSGAGALRVLLPVLIAGVLGGILGSSREDAKRRRRK